MAARVEITPERAAHSGRGAAACSCVQRSRRSIVKAIARNLARVLAASFLVACAAETGPQAIDATSSPLVIAGSAGPAPACVQNVLCIQGTKWDPTACQCVPTGCVSSAGGPCGGFTRHPCQCAPELVCVHRHFLPDFPGRCEARRHPVCDPIPCPSGEMFDSTACKCVAPECETADDCTGALPQFCQVCADGNAVCAHWSCQSGQCSVAACP
jgi:hypothetical protein